MYEQAILMGVSHDEFWFGDPRLYLCHLSAFNLKIKDRDRENWELGRYILDAIATCFSEKGKHKYPRMPYTEQQAQKIVSQNALKTRDGQIARLEMLKYKYGTIKNGQTQK